MVRRKSHVNAMVKHGVKVLFGSPVVVLREALSPPLLEKTHGMEPVTLLTQGTPVFRKTLRMNLPFSTFETLVPAIGRVQPDLVHALQEAPMQVMDTACVLCSILLVISLCADVVQIAARGQGFSSAGCPTGRWNTWILFRLVFRGCRTTWALMRQCLVVWQNAEVPEPRVVLALWGPMVDKELFRIVQSEGERWHSWLPGQVDGVMVRRKSHVNAMVKHGVKVLFGSPVVVLREALSPPLLEKTHGMEPVTLLTQGTPVFRKTLRMNLPFSTFETLVPAIGRVQPDLVHALQEDLGVVEEAIPGHLAKY